MPPRSYKLKELADILGATLVGDGEIPVARVVHPSDYAGGQDLALAMDKKLLPLLREKPVAAAVFNTDGDIEDGLAAAYLRVRRPRLAMAVLTNLFAAEPEFGSGVHPSAAVDPTARIGKDAIVGPFCTVGPRAVIGEGATLQSNVTIEAGAVVGAKTVLRAGVRIGADCVIGANCLIHFNTTIGSDGFSFVTPERGSVEAAKSDGAITATNNQGLRRIASIGNVVIGDDVEIGANTSIDRGTVAATRIGRGTKIDNQVQIGHNVRIGEDCMLCGCVSIAGSATLGNRVVIGGASGVADHVIVGDDVVVMALSGVAGNAPPRQVLGGIPALPRQRLIDNMMLTNRLKFLFKQVETLTEKMKALEPADKTG